MNQRDRQYQLLPSLITLDPLNLEQQVKILEKTGFSGLHIDLLDGYFSPSLPLGLDTVRQLRRKTNLAFDCHVMAVSNDFFIDELIDIGVQQITFHVETEKHIDGMLRKIKENGIRAGVALKPATSLQTLEYIIECCDVVLLMLINPGFASSQKEKQIPYATRKIKDLKQMISDRNVDTEIAIDGRVSKENLQAYGRQYVDQFVCGSTCLDKAHLAETADALMRYRHTLVKEAEKK